MKREQLIEISKNKPAKECWNWGESPKKRYWTVMFQGKKIGIHRIAAHVFLRTKLSRKVYVMHHCDNPACFNPAHLFTGNQFDNMRDCVAKGRNWNPNKAKTHCKNGHEFTPENTKVKRCHWGVSRKCRICSRAEERRLYHLGKRGRKIRPGRKGEHNGRSKLTVQQVLEIRATENVTIVELGKRYGVSHVVISGIRNRQSWKHI